ncbi:MAG: hypothetical protein ACPG7F_03535 [Aggregatilineales bacterium]
MKPSQNSDLTALETRLRERASTLDYPPTPDIAEAIQARLQQKSPLSAPWLRMAAALLMMSLIAFSVPEIRAAILDILQIGSVRIVPDSSYLPDVELQSLASVLDTGAEITLDNAESLMNRTIHLPDIVSAPDKILRYAVDSRNGVVLVWLNPQMTDDTIWFTLHLLDFPVFKIASQPEDTLSIGQHTALWMTQPHYLSYASDENRSWLRYIGGNVLIWYDGKITYRLEGNLTQVQAIQIAESLNLSE